jgi:hypothetical protein
MPASLSTLLEAVRSVGRPRKRLLDAFALILIRYFKMNAHSGLKLI